MWIAVFLTAYWVVGLLVCENAVVVVYWLNHQMWSGIVVEIKRVRTVNLNYVCFKIPESPISAYCSEKWKESHLHSLP